MTINLANICDAYFREQHDDVYTNNVDICKSPCTALLTSEHCYICIYIERETYMEREGERERERESEREREHCFMDCANFDFHYRTNRI